MQKKVTKTVKGLTKKERIDNIENAYKENEIIEAKVIRYDDNFNLIVDFGKKIEGIIYRDDVSLVRNEEGIVPENVVIGNLNRKIKLKVKKIDNEGQYKYVLSKKDVEVESRKWMQNNLKKNMIMYGKVRSIQSYGVFIEILEGVVGLLHIEDISVARTKHPSERFRIGQKVKVMVKDFDKDTGRVILTYKELFGTWEENAAKFKEGTNVEGIARDREKNGIFVELTPNLVGLAEHRSGIEYGQKVTVYIKKIVPEKKRIKLVIVG